MTQTPICSRCGLPHHETSDECPHTRESHTEPSTERCRSIPCCLPMSKPSDGTQAAVEAAEQITPARQEGV